MGEFGWCLKQKTPWMEEGREEQFGKLEAKML
jgi:hypothetical protein